MHRSRTANEFIRALIPLCLLEILHHAVRVERVRNDASKVEVDAFGDAVRAHDERVLVHLVLVAVVDAREVPFVLVLAVGGKVGVELVRVVVYVKVDLG